MAAQLRTATAKVGREGREESYAHGSKLGSRIFIELIAGLSTLISTYTFHGVSNCVHGCGDDPLRRMRFDMSEAAAAGFL